MRFEHPTQIGGPSEQRCVGDRDGVWVELPSGPHWMAPDVARVLARALASAADECVAARAAAPRRWR